MPQPTPRSIIICGVAGCGKSTLGAALAARLDRPFIEGDTLHPPANIARMAAGQPLDDGDRAPWLAAIAAQLAAWDAAATPGVITCSALKRSYRDRLRAGAPSRFVFLAITPAAARRRLAARPHHFMPASLVASQFAALEPPQPDETALPVAATAPTAVQVAAVLAWLGRSEPGTA